MIIIIRIDSKLRENESVAVTFVLYQRILYKLIRSYGRRSESENESSVEREPRAVPARRTTDDARAAARTTARTVPAPMALQRNRGLLCVYVCNCLAQSYEYRVREQLAPRCSVLAVVLTQRRVESSAVGTVGVSDLSRRV